MSLRACCQKNNLEKDGKGRNKSKQTKQTNRKKCRITEKEQREVVKQHFRWTDG